MTTETLEIRQLARQFAASELRPHVERWDHDGQVDELVFGQLAELGFFGMLVPEAYRGMEFDLPTYAAALEELAWGEPSVALTVATTSLVADSIVRYGSESQKQQRLELIARGESLACFALSEAAGSDPDCVATTATRVDGQWLLRGTKKWVSNGRAAALALVVARTDTGLAAFLIPTDAAGYSAAQRENTLGFRPLEIVTVELRDVKVDADAMLTVTEPAGLLASAVGLVAIGAIATGIAQAAFEHARAYADVREQFGAKLRSYEGLQFKLADMAIRTEAARLLLRMAAAEGAVAPAAMAKVFASETAMWVTTQAVQIYGGYGYMRDYPVEKLMRDAKATEMLGGGNEQLRVLIASGLYQ